MRDFNFFMPYQQKQASDKKTSSASKIPIVASVFVLLICAGIFGYNYINIGNLNSSIADLDSKMNEPEFVSKIEIVESKQAELKSLEQDEMIFSALDIFMDNQNEVNESAIRLIAGQIPDNLYLMDLSIMQNTIDIKGRANSEVAVAQFQYNLRQTGEFENIFVSEMNKEESYYNFSINFDAKGAIEDENKQ